MRGDGLVGAYTGDKRLWIHSLVRLRRKYCGNLGGGDRERGTHSRGRGGISGSGEQVFGDTGMDTDNSQVGG